MTTPPRKFPNEVPNPEVKTEAGHRAELAARVEKRGSLLPEPEELAETLVETIRRVKEQAWNAGYNACQRGVQYSRNPYSTRNAGL